MPLGTVLFGTFCVPLGTVLFGTFVPLGVTFVTSLPLVGIMECCAFHALDVFFLTHFLAELSKNVFLYRI